MEGEEFTKHKSPKTLLVSEKGDLLFLLYCVQPVTESRSHKKKRMLKEYREQRICSSSSLLQLRAAATVKSCAGHLGGRGVRSIEGGLLSVPITYARREAFSLSFFPLPPQRVL